MAKTVQRFDEIECPKCGTAIPVSETLRHQLTEHIREELEEKVGQREKDILLKEKELKDKEKRLGEDEKDVEKRVQKEVNVALEKEKAQFSIREQQIKKRETEITAEKEAIEKRVREEVGQERIKIEVQAKKRATEELSIELKDKDTQIKEQEAALKISRETELTARKREREAEDKIKNADLEVEKKLAAERGTLEVEISKRYSEEYSLKEREGQKKISDLLRQLDEAKIKAEQGSQQMQGEVQELDLEEALREAFPQDLIEPVGKGVRGADVRQKVRTSAGKIAGVILWETKRTKSWSDGWLGKLKDDLRAEAANIPVILSAVLPEEASSGFGQKDGVWICKPSIAIPIAFAFRRQLLEVALVNSQAENRGTLADSLYDYVISHEFRQQIESMVETHREMKEQVTRERISYERSWKARESQIDRMLTGTARIAGSIQGRLGDAAFGPVKGLELPEGESVADVEPEMEQDK